MQSESGEFGNVWGLEVSFAVSFAVSVSVSVSAFAVFARKPTTITIMTKGKSMCALCSGAETPNRLRSDHAYTPPWVERPLKVRFHPTGPARSARPPIPG